MSHDFIQTHYKVSAADTPNMDSAGSTSEFVFGCPVRPLRVGIIVTTILDPDNSVDMTVSIYRYLQPGVSTNAVKLGTFKIMAANATNLPVGTVVYKDLHLDTLTTTQQTAEDSKTRNVAPVTTFNTTTLNSQELNDILIGQTLVLKLDTNAEADSGAAYSFVEYAELPFQKQFFYSANAVNKDTSEDLSHNPSS